VDTRPSRCQLDIAEIISEEVSPSLPSGKCFLLNSFYSFSSSQLLNWQHQEQQLRKVRPRVAMADRASWCCHRVKRRSRGKGGTDWKICESTLLVTLCFVSITGYSLAVAKVKTHKVWIYICQPWSSWSGWKGQEEEKKKLFNDLSPVRVKLEERRK
jgi:hypothetical protein